MGDFNFFYNKPNNLQYLSSGAVSGSSRTSRLKYNQLSHTPVITSRERTLKAISRNTYSPGTSEGWRPQSYRYQSWKKTTKIVGNTSALERKYKNKMGGVNPPEIVSQQEEANFSNISFVDNMIKSPNKGIQTSNMNSNELEKYINSVSLSSDIPNNTSDKLPVMENKDVLNKDVFINTINPTEEVIFQPPSVKHVVDEHVDEVIFQPPHVRLESEPSVLKYKTGLSDVGTQYDISGNEISKSVKTNILTNEAYTQSTYTETIETTYATNNGISYLTSDNQRIEGDINDVIVDGIKRKGNGVVDILDIQYLSNWLNAQPANIEDRIYNQYVTNTNDGGQYIMNTYSEGADTYVVPDGQECPCDNNYDTLNDPNDTTNYSNMNLQLKSLYDNAGELVDQLLTQFIGGDLAGVKTILSTDYYNQLATAIFNEKCDRFANSNTGENYYDNMRLIISHALSSIEQTVQTESDLQIELDTALTDLYNCRNPPQALFTLETSIETVAEIRPEYQQYINLYGIPEGGFDPDKLAEIINTL
jgi:hypothetical protein